eukprot:9156591-Pyramimonas_sp.AAC.1
MAANEATSGDANIQQGFGLMRQAVHGASTMTLSGATAILGILRTTGFSGPQRTELATVVNSK